MINMTEDHFLSLLQETRSHIDWYLDGLFEQSIRGKIRCLNTKQKVCPITGVAWYLGYPLSGLTRLQESAVNIGLAEDLAWSIAQAGDHGGCAHGMKQSLLRATGLA
ncbi:MAG: hypothetical protein MN733_05465 [Nitrososphaera sp.]|nr:hypothetical protein [Nitrososphaera sp.]